MLNKHNAIGAIVVLKNVHSMPNGTPLTVIDYTNGDAGTKYKKMINVFCNKSYKSNWIMLHSVKSVLSFGYPVEPCNVKLTLKQLAILNHQTI